MSRHISNFLILWSTLFILVILVFVYTAGPKVIGQRVVMGQKYTAVLHAYTTQVQK